jgi:hypothetical protein
MAENDNELPVTIPEKLRRQFAGAQRRLWRVETTIALSVMTAGLVLSLLALFVSDRLWNTPPGWRIAFLAAGLFSVLAASWFWAQRWLWRRRSLEDLARLIQKKHRLLGDRLLGIVELSHEQCHLANFSPALYHAAIQQVAGEAEKYDFRQSVNIRPAEKFAGGAGIILIGWLGICLLFPQAGWNSFIRWLAPANDIPRYTLVSLDGVPQKMVVAHGEPFVVSGHVQYRSFWKPGRVAGRLPTLPKIEGAVNAGQFHLLIPGQVENGLLHLRVGDAAAEIKVTPVYRPALRELTAQIQLPAYLQYPDQTQLVQSGSLLVLEGSKVAFLGKTSRPLASAQMRPSAGDATALKIEMGNFHSTPAPLDGMGEYVFNWQDDIGLSNAAPLRISVATQKDAPPIPDLPGLPHTTAMLDSDVLHIQAEAVDDFGVRDLGLTWETESDTPLTEGITSEIKTMTASPRVKKIQKVFLWSPRSFHIPADSTVELQGYARDYFPERERARTSVYHIRILSREEHAELVREQLDAIMARIEEVTCLQEKVASNLHDTQDNPKLSDTQKNARIGQSKSDQLENSSHLDQLSQQAESAIQEAMKNPVFPGENIRQWSQTAQQWQKLAKQKMPQAASAMQAAQENPASRQKQTAEAARQADDILRELEKMQDKASRQMDDLQALTLAQRLRKIGTEEKEISGQLLKSASDLIGLPPSDLPEPLKHFEHALTSDQGRVQKESDALQGEISRFFERTQKTNYGAVSQEMKNSRTTDELERLGGMIGDNIVMEASGDLSLWSDRFQKWGDALEPPEENSSGGSSGQKGKSQQKDLTKQLIALLRLRESEMNLRDQTSVLDQQKGEPASFKERAASLSETQKKLGGQLDRIHQDTGLAALDPAFAQGEAAMNETATVLQRPETGPPADDAEGKTVDALSDLVNLINEQARHGKPQPSPDGKPDSAEEMAFLTRMMQNPADTKAMALQPASGLNSAGGRAAGAGQTVTGKAAGKNTDARQVNKASGVIENSPAEFRDALDNYFHGIEDNKN